MKLSDIGEFGLIRRFSPAFLKKLPAGVTGIGDDCAVLPWTKSRILLVTTDLLVEDIHFIRARIAARDLGHKSLAVNLSDIAAMGGTPRSAFLSIGLPRNMDVSWLDEFFRGFASLAGMAKVRLLGGDTTGSPGPLVINVALLGEARRDRVKYRSGAENGDIICVTGNLGDSGGGLRVLLEERPLRRDERYLVRCHNRPNAHLAEGAWLAARDAVTAMMDVSDGIDSDLRRIMERSRCGAAVDLDRLPLSLPLVSAARKYGWNPLEIAASGGEDYCLLATVRAGRFANVSSAFARKFGRPLFRIGTIAGQKAGLIYKLNGRAVVLKRHGFDHFA
jgi:thiamine-monophosphate kinase